MMTFTVEVTKRESAEVAFLRVEAGVRYWEDAKINGEQDDEDNPTVPCRRGDTWAPTIRLADGKIDGWPEGTTADIHYKVCDAGRYTLLDGDGQAVRSIDGYVPRIMCPADNGYGDYIIMSIGGDGVIANWRVDLAAFEERP